MSNTQDMTVVCSACDQELTVEIEKIPSENYGADADGRRGMWIPAHYDFADDPTELKCECGAVVTAEAERALDKRNDDDWYEDTSEAKESY